MPTVYSIREATKDDRDTLLSLMRMADAEQRAKQGIAQDPDNPMPARTLGIIFDSINRGEGRCWIGADRDNKAVAYLYVVPEQEGQPRGPGSGLFTHADHRKQGLGGALMEKFAKFGENRGMEMESAVLANNAEAISLYTKLGWEFSTAGNGVLKMSKPAAGVTPPQATDQPNSCSKKATGPVISN